MISIFVVCDLILSSIYGVKLVLNVDVIYDPEKQRKLYNMEKYGLPFILDENFDMLSISKSIFFKIENKHYTDDGHTRNEMKNWDLYLQSRFLLYYVFLKYLITVKRVFSTNRFLDVISRLTPHGLYVELLEYIKSNCAKCRFCNHIRDKITRDHFVQLLNKMQDIIYDAHDGNHQEMSENKLKELAFPVLADLYENTFSLIGGMCIT